MKWTTLEYHHPERTSDWFWGVGLVTVAGAGAAFYFNNILFAVLILLSAVTLIIFALRHPREIEVELSEKGVRIEKTLYPYSSLESFWIDEEIEPARLLIKPESLFAPLVAVMIEEVDLDELEQFLVERIQMEELEEPFFQRIMEHLGF